MKKYLNVFTTVLIVISIVLASCSHKKSEEERQKQINDSLAKAQAVADSIKKVEAYFPKSLAIQGSNVNMRIAPKLDAVRIKQLKTGDSCEVLEKGEKQTIDDKTDYWYKINFKGKEGWIFGAYTSIKLAPQPAEKPKTENKDNKK